MAKGLAEFLQSKGLRVEILDGQMVRDQLMGFFGYSREERVRVNRLLCVLARLLARHEIVPIVTSITPHQESRDFNRLELVQYVEIFVDCSSETCMVRDQRGMYRRALRGDLRHFIGVDDPFEIPKSPDLHVNTERESVEVSLCKVQAFACRIMDLSL